MPSGTTIGNTQEVRFPATVSKNCGPSCRCTKEDSTRALANDLSVDEGAHVQAIQGCQLCSAEEQWRLPSKRTLSTIWKKWPTRILYGGRTSDKVTEVLTDQAEGGQVLKRTEDEARSRSLDLVFASLGALRKAKVNGLVTERVFFDGTNGIFREQSYAHRGPGSALQLRPN